MGKYEDSCRPVGTKRRRPRQRHIRLGIIPGCLILMLSVIFVISVLEGCAQTSIAEFETPAAPEGRNELFQEILFCPDTQPPVILGAGDLLTRAGEAVSYPPDVAAVDDTDPAPILRVDASQVDLTTPGQYPVFYVAADAAGNITWETVILTVLPGEEVCL